MPSVEPLESFPPVRPITPSKFTSGTVTLSGIVSLFSAIVNIGFLLGESDTAAYAVPANASAIAPEFNVIDGLVGEIRLFKSTSIVSDVLFALL
jgi:hypothetical protein